MGSIAKPTILLVPGAWLPPKVFTTFVETLKTYQYTDIVVASYPSINPPAETAHTTDCAADTTHIRTNYLLPLLEAGKSVVIIAHSYGGMPAAGCATGLTLRSRRATNLPGGVLGLIMVSAFVVSEGLSCAGAMGGDTPPWVLKDKPAKNLCLPADPHEMFAFDVPLSLAQPCLDIIVPHATLAFFSNQPKPVFVEEEFKGLFAYVKQMADQAVPVPGQEAMLSYSGVEWVTREVPFSHNAGFITGTEKMVRVVEDLVGVFERVV